MPQKKKKERNFSQQWKLKKKKINVLWNWFTLKDITKMSAGGGWGDVGKQKKKTRERKTE